jgi:hypothetical protein
MALLDYDDWIGLYAKTGTRIGLKGLGGYGGPETGVKGLYLGILILQSYLDLLNAANSAL